MDPGSQTPPLTPQTHNGGGRGGHWGVLEGIPEATEMSCRTWQGHGGHGVILKDIRGSWGPRGRSWRTLKGPGGYGRLLESLGRSWRTWGGPEGHQVILGPQERSWRTLGGPGRDPGGHEEGPGELGKVLEDVG